MKVELYQEDLPADLNFTGSVAIDTETLGLQPMRDRLCLAQLSGGDGVAHIVKFSGETYTAPNLKAVLKNNDILKIFHFARFDIAFLLHYLGVSTEPVYCTKIASRLVRTNIDRHSLKDLCRELLGQELSKEQQRTDWGASELTSEQLAYAASDVLYLHRLKEKLDHLLMRENRTHLADACYQFLPMRAELDLAGWGEQDIFAH